MNLSIFDEVKTVAYCIQCGQELRADARFCDRCGTPVSADTMGAAVRVPLRTGGTGTRRTVKRKSEFRRNLDAVRNLFCLLYAYREDTGTVSEKDRNENRSVAVLCYLHFLVLVPMFAMRESPFVRYHAKRGVRLFLYHVILELFFGILLHWLGGIFILGTILRILFICAEVILCSFSVFGIRAVVRGKAHALLLLEPRTK